MAAILFGHQFGNLRIVSVFQLSVPKRGKPIAGVATYNDPTVTGPFQSQGKTGMRVGTSWDVAELKFILAEWRHMVT